MNYFLDFLAKATFNAQPQYLYYIIFAIYLLAVAAVISIAIALPIVLHKRRIRSHQSTLVIRDACGNILSNKMLYFSSIRLDSLSATVFKRLDAAFYQQKLSRDEILQFIINLGQTQLRPQQAAFLLGYQIARLNKPEMHCFSRMISACGYGNADTFIQHATKLKIVTEPLKTGWNMLECVLELVYHRKWRMLIGLVLSLDENETDEISSIMHHLHGCSFSEYLAAHLPRRQQFSRLLVAWASYMRFAHSRLKDDATSLFFSFQDREFKCTQLLTALTTTLSYEFDQVAEFIHQMAYKTLCQLIARQFRHNTLDLMAYYLAFHFATNRKQGAISFLLTEPEENCALIASSIAGEGLFATAVEKVQEHQVGQLKAKGQWGYFIEGCKQAK